jgi:hypothetical protein
VHADLLPRATPAEAIQADRYPRPFRLTEMQQGLIAGFLVGFCIAIGALLS